MAQRSDGTREQERPGGITPIPMVCPQCKSSEIDPEGKCLVCGLRVAEEKPAPPPRAGDSVGAEGAIKVEFSSSPSDQNPEIPEWRHELSRRLTEIKRKRGEVVPSEPSPPAKTLTFPQAETPVQTRAQSQPPVDAPLKPVITRQAAAGLQDKIVRLPERNAPRQPRAPKKSDAPLPLFQPARLKAGQQSMPTDADLKLIPKVTDPDPAALQNLLDSIALRQSAPAVASLRAPDAVKKPAHRSPDKLILLSRALSGFVDLSIVGLLAASILLSADFFSGIEMIDTVSRIWYAALLLATYLVYSTFFLGTSNQTIGMMIKDLRVVGENGKRPKIEQVLMLSAAYLPSVMGFGLGLLYACFDRDSRCLHDRLSHTRVIRL